MRVSTWGYGFSIAVHLGVAAGLQTLPERKTAQAASVTVIQATVQPPPPAPPPQPIEAKEAKVEAPAPAPKAAPPPPAQRAVAKRAAPPPSEPRADMRPPPANPLPDFGLSMEGTVASGGLAIPVGDPSAPRAQPTRPSGDTRVTRAANPSRDTSAKDSCDDAIVKPKPLGAVQPQYTDEARAAGIEGRVRLQLTIDLAGNVLDAVVVQGLGHGLDNAAVVAAKRMKFSPATRCNKPIESPFGLSMRFVLGE